MKIKVISDLHLGVKNDITNEFKRDDQLFDGYIRDAVENYDYVILNGDTFELWQDMFTTHGDSIKEKILNRLDEIINSWSFGKLLVEHPKIIIINGNHDAYIKKYNKFKKTVTDQVVFTAGDMKLCIAHGHQGDLFCKDSSIVKNIICCYDQSISTFEKLIDKNLDNDISNSSNVWRQVIII